MRLPLTLSSSIRNAYAIPPAVSLRDGDPLTTYSVEVFEQTADCGSDNLADTGIRLTTDAGGDGTAVVVMQLPYRSLGGAVLGDLAGTEAVIVVLDNSLSTNAGDWFSTLAIPIPTAARR